MVSSVVSAVVIIIIAGGDGVPNLAGGAVPWRSRPDCHADGLSLHERLEARRVFIRWSSKR